MGTGTGRKRSCYTDVGACEDGVAALKLKGSELSSFACTGYKASAPFWKLEITKSHFRPPTIDYVKLLHPIEIMSHSPMHDNGPIGNIFKGTAGESFCFLFFLFSFLLFVVVRQIGQSFSFSFSLSFSFSFSFCFDFSFCVLSFSQIMNQNGATSGFEMCFAVHPAPLVPGSQPKQHASNPTRMTVKPLWFVSTKTLECNVGTCKPISIALVLAFQAMPTSGAPAWRNARRNASGLLCSSSAPPSSSPPW